MKSKFSLNPRKLIAGKYFGQFQSIFGGIGTDASDVRLYSPGDSAKTINRKATAKHQQLYSNVYHQEKAITLDILRDVNYNRNGEVKGKPNYERVRECMSDIILYAKTYGAILNIFYAKKKGFRRSELALHEEMIGKQYDQALALIMQLPAIAKKMPKNYSSNIAAFLQRMNKNKKRRAIVIFSDFLDVDEQAKKRLQQAKKEHVVLLYQLPVHAELGQNYDASMINERKNMGLDVMRMR